MVEFVLCEFMVPCGGKSVISRVITNHIQNITVLLNCPKDIREPEMRVLEGLKIAYYKSLVLWVEVKKSEMIKQWFQK